MTLARNVILFSVKFIVHTSLKFDDAVDFCNQLGMTLPTPIDIWDYYKTMDRLYPGYSQYDTDYFMGYEYNGNCWINIYEQASGNSSCADWVGYVNPRDFYNATDGDHFSVGPYDPKITDVDYKPYRTVCVTKDFHGNAILLCHEKYFPSAELYSLLAPFGISYLIIVY